jgi:hypothetical protein
MRTLTELPGPRGLPLVGNLLQLDLKQLHRARPVHFPPGLD